MSDSTPARIREQNPVDEPSNSICCSCTVVLFNPRKNSQAHVLNASRKTVTSLALAGDGKLLATGECGHMPNVRVWDISDPHNAVQIAEFPGHKYGINCVVSSCE
jgi:WD40 repeat protein